MGVSKLSLLKFQICVYVKIGLSRTYLSPTNTNRDLACDLEINYKGLLKTILFLQIVILTFYSWFGRSGKFYAQIMYYIWSFPSSALTTVSWKLNYVYILFYLACNGTEHGFLTLPLICKVFLKVIPHHRK